MKKVILTALIIMMAFPSYGQQKKFGTKIIGQWSLEKFPLHYSVVSPKKMLYKNQQTGKLEVYEEQNQLGQTSGLKMIMGSDGINPYSANYIYNGEIVYSAYYFPNSQIANSITTYNSKGQKDGFRITRTMKESGGYLEEVEKYEDDVLIELNGVKQASSALVFKDHLLNGRFKFENSRWIIEGVAENGKLKTIKQTQEGLHFMCEIVFLNDSITIKEPYTSKEGFSIEKYPLVSNPIITDSKSLCLKNGNYNGFPYLVMSDDFDIRDLKDIVKHIHPEPLSTEINFVDSLLDGDFQFRQYLLSYDYEYNGIMNISGKANKGILNFLRIRTVEYDSHSGDISTDKIVEYTFYKDKIEQKEFVSEESKEPISTKTFGLLNPVLLTNSNILGGSYKYDYQNTNNVLNVPIKKEARLEGNKKGYMYFSPTTFDISNLLPIITEKAY